MFNFRFLFLSLLLFSSVNSFVSANPTDITSQIVLNLKSAEMQVEQAEAIVNSGQLQEAQAMVAKLRPLLSEFTELHSQLYESLKNDAAATITAENEKKQTIEFAKLRDKANYLAGVISMKQGNNREAVKHFVLVVQSQRTTGLGEKAYRALRELGFSPKLAITEQI